MNIICIIWPERNCIIRHPTFIKTRTYASAISTNTANNYDIFIVILVTVIKNPITTINRKNTSFSRANLSI